MSDRQSLNDIAKASARSSFYLFLGQSISTVLLAVTTILIGRLLGPENYGIYTVALTVPSLLLEVSDLGISSALVRFIAKLCSEGKHGEATRLSKIGILFKTLTSIGVSLVFLLLSGEIATVILKRPEISLFVGVGALYLLGQAILGTINAIYIGLDRTEISGFLVNVQAVSKAFVSIILIILGYGVMGALLGIGFSPLFTAVVGILLLLRVLKRFRQTNTSNHSSFLEGLRPMLAYGTPLYASNLLVSLLPQYYGLILAYFVSNEAIGNYATAMNFSVLVSVITTPLATALFPAFSKLSIQKNRESVERMFRLAVKYTSLIVIPTSIALALFSKELVTILYGSSFNDAPNYLSLYALHFLTAGLGMLVLGNFFNGQGDTKTVFKVGLVRFFSSLILSPVFTSFDGVRGLIVSILISQLASTILALLLSKRIYKVEIDFSSSLRICVSSFLSAMVIMVLLNIFTISILPIKLLILGSIYIATFLVVAPLIGAINREDIQYLRNSIEGLSIIRPFAMILLGFEMALLSLVKR